MSEAAKSLEDSSFTTTSEQYYEKTEYLHFPKVVKQHGVSLPPVLTPIFKWKPEENADKKEEREPEDKSTRSAVMEDIEYDEYGEEEYGTSEFEYDYEEEEGVGELLTSVSEEAKGAPTNEVAPNFGSPPTLATLCLKAFADNFQKMWKHVKFIPEKNMLQLARLIDFEKIDVGLAAKTFHDDLLWKMWTNHKWPGYHNPWAHRGSWKHYFLQKYLSERISNQPPNDSSVKWLLVLAKRTYPWIYTLNITGVRAPSWPAAVDIDSSTGTESDLASEVDLKSDLSLGEYLNRHINFYPPPTSVDRLLLQPIFERLEFLTHLSFSFGFQNYSSHRTARFAKISIDDAENLSGALRVCKSLFCFKLSQSKLTPNLLAVILSGLAQMEFLRELDLSHLFLTNKHMDPVSDFLAIKRHIRALGLKNNDIGADGFIKLLHVVILEDCKLKLLDVSMNPIGDPGGVAMAALLAKKAKYLRKVFMSGTGLTSSSGYNFGVVLYFNKCLEELDLSLNEFSDFAAEALMKGMEHNYTLKRLNVRECGIPFPTIVELERMCYSNAERAHQQQYTYPTVHPVSYKSGISILETGNLEHKKHISEDDLEREEGEITLELMQIFAWATYPMKPRNRLVLLRDLHSWMKKTSFVAAFDVIADKLILTKQKELILKARIDEMREQQERAVSSGAMADSSLQEFNKKTNEKFKADFKEVEAIQVLKNVNRCGRLDALFKFLKPDRLDAVLKKIGKALDTENDFILSAGMNLPFAKKYYRGFPEPESMGEEEVLGEGEEEETCQYIPRELVSQFDNPGIAGFCSFQVMPIVENQTKPKQQGIAGALPVFPNEEAFLIARDKAIGTRSGYNKWPKDEPPEFPKVIPFEIVDECFSNLPDTDSEKEEDFPYWCNQWVQKF